MLTEGDKVHVTIRRSFEKGIRRHSFADISTIASQYIIAEGYAFHHDTTKGEFIEPKHLCECVVPMTSSGVIITLLPDAADLDATEYEFIDNGSPVLTDSASFQLDINEFGSHY